MKYRLTAFLLALSMLFTLAACGGDTGGGPSSDGDTPGNSSAAPSAPDADSAAPTAPEAAPSPSSHSPDSPSEPATNPAVPSMPAESPAAPTAEPEPSGSPSREPEPVASRTPEPVPSQTPEPSASQTPEPTPTPTPEPTPTPTPEPAPTPTSPAQSDGVDLQAFFEDLLVKYEEAYFRPNMPVEGDFLTNYYPGLEDITLKQRVIYQPMISAVVCEIALAEAANADDAQAVKDIFQARIDYQVGTDENPGGAWYPASIEGWKNDSRIVTNGNFVMMIVWEDCDRIVDDFNALF